MEIKSTKTNIFELYKVTFYCIATICPIYNSNNIILDVTIKINVRVRYGTLVMIEDSCMTTRHCL